MLDYVLIMSPDSTAPVNLPSYIENYEDKDLTTFEIIALLYQKKAIFIKPKASQIALLRTVAASNPIELLIFTPDEDVISAIFMTEATGIPRITNVADIDVLFDDSKIIESEGEDDADVESEPDLDDEEVDTFTQGG